MARWQPPSDYLLGQHHAVPPGSLFQPMIGPRGLRENVAFYWRPLLLVVVVVVLVGGWIAGRL